MRRGWIIGAAALAIFGIAAASQPDTSNYDGQASVILNVTWQRWVVVDSASSVRSIRIETAGVMDNPDFSGQNYPVYQFACWWDTPSGKVGIDNALVLATPKPNNDTLVISQNYPDGFAAPDGSDPVACGWSASQPGFPLTYGFARVQLLYQDG